MFPRVKQVRYLGDYRLELGFADGVVGELDFAARVVGRGGMFAPLEDVEFFKQVQVDPEAGTIVWPNGVDLCPDVLYSQVTGKPIHSERKAQTRTSRPKRARQLMPANPSVPVQPL
ncbi:MAG TPA: DUF2442 domain-containing protein [Anaerolineae bacterium]|nr:DUF2442 domain-containing protein [Anaerolineae bacterium]HQI87403.1 DUF2442 domain-containing protein [Anaerolineae bacterium]